MKGNKDSCLFSKPPAHSIAFSIANLKHRGHRQHSRANVSLKYIILFRQGKQTHSISSITSSSHSIISSKMFKNPSQSPHLQIVENTSRWGWLAYFFDPKRFSFPLVRRTLRPFSSQRLARSFFVVVGILVWLGFWEMCVFATTFYAMDLKSNAATTAAKYSVTLWRHSTTYKAKIFFRTFAVHGSVVDF